MRTRRWKQEYKINTYQLPNNRLLPWQTNYQKNQNKKRIKKQTQIFTYNGLYGVAVRLSTFYLNLEVASMIHTYDRENTHHPLCYTSFARSPHVNFQELWCNINKKKTVLDLERLQGFTKRKRITCKKQKIERK